MDIRTRPRPILDKLNSVGSVLSALGGLVAWAGTAGLLTTQQTAASAGLLAIVPGVVTAVGGWLVAFGVTKSAEPLVTPVESPRNDKGETLVPTSTPERFRLRDSGEDASTL